ncbi:DUF4168 domain-containing protein [Acidiferrobacter thiooxydans]|jgi:hypothetical protein|uniref:DUF4168 domain-containing protein n=1 Tax=Acidiferrobacter thiooxydans TaxID=163359 RepID=A0A1C2G0Z6_9GAMM|nr:DUF4168 domain-containing protein [Acidiferrobacter thiooxydans]MDA8192064.1 DUF4168 domain-containing protein [Gammaproteobacteria bacterium]RCN55275.1 DUF4168 domain-containing protein [Acidiferrobacter thiooxydans]RCN55297.1 DUF4168 domain-containing protein [Acidiferrobacter thiooxydans]RCN55882.1 DUF4168 domain-containing protein [Acidiferrobacter thiooxydans]UEN98865.1 DUF4168 domain-containing protein [Acidiferrobacter thiooxydans]
MESSRTALRLALTTAITLASASAFAATQAPAAATAHMPPPGATAMPRIGHTTLKHFVTAIRHVSQIRAAYAKKLQAMKGQPGAARGIQVRAQQSMIAAIKGQHLTLPQYNNLVRQVDADPTLRARVLHMLRQ